MNSEALVIKPGKHFSALRSANYRWYIAGMLVSVVGTWIQIIAMGWLVYRLTDSIILLGLMGFLSQIPSLIVTPIAGVYADRVQRKKIIMFTQISAMLLSFLLALLVLTGTVQVWHLLAIAVGNGIVNGIDTPFRHAFVRDMIDEPEQLQNAIALNSTLFNMARFVGPSIGGFLIHFMGEGWCFFINGLTFFAVIFSLLKMNIKVPLFKKSERNVWNDLVDGMKYCVGNVPVRYLLLLVAASGLLCLPFQQFLPVYARDILHGDSGLYGLLTGAYGAGALCGALFLAFRKRIAGLPMIIALASFLFSGGLLIFAQSQSILLSLFILVPAGFGMIAQYTSTNTLLQLISDPDKVGRVISFYGISFMGITPLGTLLIGFMSHYYNINIVLLGSIGISFIFVFLFYLRRKVIDQAIESRGL